MNYWVRFWVVVGSLLVGLSALGFLVMSFVFPDARLFDVGAPERLAVALLAVVSLSVIVWSGFTDDGVVGPTGSHGRR